MIHAKLDPNQDTHKSIIEALGKLPASTPESIPVKTQQEIGQVINVELANPFQRFEHGKDTVFGPYSAIKFLQDLYDKHSRQIHDLQESHGRLRSELYQTIGDFTGNESRITINNWAKLFGVKNLIPNLFVDGSDIKKRRNAKAHDIKAHQFLELISNMEKEGREYTGSELGNRTTFLRLSDGFFAGCFGVTKKEAERWFGWKWKDPGCVEKVLEALHSHSCLARHLHGDIHDSESTYSKSFKKFCDKLNSASSEGTTSPPSDSQEEVIQAFDHLDKNTPKIKKKDYLSSFLRKQNKKFTDSGTKEKFELILQRKKDFVEKTWGDEGMAEVRQKADMERDEEQRKNGK